MPQVVLPDTTAASRLAVANIPKPPNLLGMAQQGVQLRGGMLQNQNLQNQLTEFQSRQAAGRDFQQNINPLTGQLDQQGLNRALATDPRAALSAQQMSQQGLANLQAQLQNQGIDQSNAIQRLKWTYDQTGALLQQPNVTRPDVIDSLTNAVKDGILPAKDAASVIPTIPENGPQLRQYLQERFAQAQGSIQAIAPHIQMVDNGKYQIAYNSNPAYGNGIGPAGPAVVNTLSPAQQAQPVSLPTPSGAQVVTTLGGIAQGGQPPIIASGITPADQAAQSAQGTGSANQGVALVQSASQLAPQRAMLQSIIAESGAANTGPIAGQMAKLGGVLQQFGIKGFDQATAYQLTQKSTMQYVGQAMQSMGVPTDGKMLSMEMATPNASMTPEAVKAAGGMLMGGLDYKQAQAKAWTQYQAANGPASYPQFQAAWNQNVPNAAAFQLQYLPQAEKSRYIKSLSSAQKQQLLNSYNWLGENGFLGQ